MKKSPQLNPRPPANAQTKSYGGGLGPAVPFEFILVAVLAVAGVLMLIGGL